ncbi:MAG: hypothetical protein AAFN78_08450 [Pseudomonadota bacterium]
MLRSLLAPTLVLCAAGLAAALVLPLPQPAAVSLPATIALAALLLMPAVVCADFSTLDALRQSAAWSFLAGACAALAVGAAVRDGGIITAAVATALVVLAGAALWWLLERNAPPGVHWRFTTVLFLASSAPLWAAPLAELHAPLATLVACASPLSLLGVLMDHDYLRTAFFYQHSALGALSYRYPSAGAFVVAYAVGGAALWTIALMKTMGPRNVTENR